VAGVGVARKEEGWVKRKTRRETKAQLWFPETMQDLHCSQRTLLYPWTMS